MAISQRSITALELLSPARNLDYGIAAINCGADAVYIGAARFGARSAVGNPMADIEKLANYAHKYRAKVYVALNTLLFDHELSEAFDIAHKVWQAGADALIVQDMGLLEMPLPPISIFASTQTHNATWQKVKFLEEVGIKRAILARELSLAEIAEIRQHSTIELESFVHGAICVGYSGQCYLSHALTGRSGNRGECAQPCRWQYSLTNENGKVLKKDQHLISPKDLNLSDSLEGLVNAGITSFKIEGRLKDLSYLKNITSVYRQKLDAIIGQHGGAFQKASSGKSYIDWQPDAQKTFNRGFTNYFVNGRQAGLVSFNSPKSLGKAIGKVEKVLNNVIIVGSNQKFTNGDGLCFVDSSGQLSGFRVNTAEGNKLYPAEMPQISVGAELFRNHDQEFEKILNKPTEKRKIAVNLCFTETANGFALLAKDTDGICVETSVTAEKKLATNTEKAHQTITQQLGKAGNTIFEVEAIDIQLQTKYFIQASVLNELRRQVLEMLECKRLSTYIRSEGAIIPNNYPYPEANLNYKGNVLNKKSEAFYKRHGVGNVEVGFELATDYKGKELMTTRYCLKYELGACPKSENYNNNNEFKETMYLQWGKGKLKVEFDCKNCQMKIM